MRSRHGAADGPVRIVARDAGSAVVVAVHNLGPPITSDAMSKIFEPMLTGQGEGAVESTSMGLRLYIAHEIVAAHHGTIDVTSGENEGTTFTVSLPRS